jgi:hypothetical protein
MAKKPNYLLGYGERLTEPVEIKGGGGEKLPPYPFSEAKARLSRMLTTAVKSIQSLPESACPNGEAVASFTLHPEYFAKSYHPGGFFQEAGLRPVGSKSTTITPEQRSRGRESE